MPGKTRSSRLFIYVFTLALLISQLPFSAFVSAASATYEAESAARAGGVVIATDHTGYTGSGFVGGYTDANKGNAATTFTVNASAAGSYTTTARYSNGTGSAKTLSLYVNGTKLKQISLPATSDWSSWSTQSETVSLNSGSNTIAYKFETTDSGNVNLDNIVLSDTTSGTAPSGTNLALNKSISSNNNYTGFGAANAVDGNASTYYEGAANSYPNTLTVDLGSAQSVNSVVLKLPASWGTRTQTFSVAASTDNNTFTTVAASETYTFNPSSGNTVTVSFAASSARSVRVNFTANSGAAGGQISELEVYGSGGTVTPPDSPAGTYEAEAAVLSGGASVATDHAGYSGTGFAGGFIDSNKGNASATFHVNVTKAGSYTVALKYANGSTAAQTLSLYANGIKATQTSLPATANWDSWSTKADTVNLNAGTNTIMYKYDTTDTGNVNIDKIDVAIVETPPVTPPPSGTYGATMPYDAYEAESVSYTGTVIGPNTTFGSLASEASGRKAVQLTAAGQYVQFTLAKAAKGVTIRYSIPDNAAGTGIDSAISMYIGGALFKDINLTSRYSWNYGAWGTEGGEIRWSNNPNATPTTPHHLYDEVSVVLNQEYPAGTVIKLQRNATNLNFTSTANVTIDLFETEAIPAALTMPSNYVSITSYGAVANDGADDTTAINNAINAVKNSGGTYKGVWLPAGAFTLNNGNKGAGYNGSGTRLYLDSGVSMKGAGIWYSTLSGNYAGLYLRGGNVTISDFKISANDIIRDDYNGVSGVEGNGTNSTLTNLWIEHTKVGFWLTNQTNNATISNSRIRDVWADGLNLHYGTSNTTVTNNSVRNSGDDGLAMWSDTYLDTNNTFSYNTVQIPTLANNIAIYGGKDNKVIGNLLTDTVVNGSGISFGTNFNPPSMTGTLTVQNNVLIRTGSYHKDYGYQIGAIWAYWLNNTGKAQNLTVTVSGNTIQDSVYSGIFIEEPAPSISVTYASNAITNSGTYGVYIRGTATGSSVFNNNTVSGAPSGKFSNTSSSFTATGSGNNW
ncbi:carbohydrate binding protein with CBM6 domain [Paenibacillus sp. BK033]|uniref:galactose-binding domain-containing protein n=1 Tax=Paenibacillus sp. BK033 TaxID=2512133 RepID=UPI00104A07B2|nr:discoidin domain-containing protein [Paenibacillus sp. BK033]TCM99319.1 carbohydrate binding protein with CBM6 domain [Paenibacillus sp. BK033]